MEYNEEKEVARPKIWCGRSDDLPADYDEIGSPYQCLRKGVGVGKYVLVGHNPPNGPGVSPEKYCGTSNVLPPGKTRIGGRYECLKTGVGVGLGLQNAVPAGVNHGMYVKSGLTPITEPLPINGKKQRPKKTKTRVRAAKKSTKKSPTYEPNSDADRADEFETNRYDPTYDEFEYQPNSEADYADIYESQNNERVPMETLFNVLSALLGLLTVVYVVRLFTTKNRYKENIKEDYEHKKRHFRWVHG